METLIDLHYITRNFGKGKEQVTAVDDISISIKHGEIVCLVGESGCGKSTTGNMAAGLLSTSSGKVLYRGKDIQEMNREEYRQYRHGVQIIHQDPYASLNPTQTVYQIISAPLLRHKFVHNHVEAQQRCEELMDIVGLTPPEDYLVKYPHQLSGGQRQRVSVARALTMNPKFMVADEAVSMVDVSLRVSILNMLTRLRNEFDVTFLFITHDLALAKYFAWEGGRIIVMYLGRIVEEGPTARVIENPRHPYTQALLSAVPEADPEIARRKRPIKLRSADIPSLLDLPPGCTFHPRCPHFVPGQCDVGIPASIPIEGGGMAACPVLNVDPQAA